MPEAPAPERPEGCRSGSRGLVRFYINIGLDRLVMMRYGVDDVRLFHSADLRFLSQFK